MPIVPVEDRSEEHTSDSSHTNIYTLSLHDALPISNGHWQDEVPAEPPVTRQQHENIAKGYSNAFLQRYVNGVAAASAYFTGNIRLASVAGVELHHAYRTGGGQIGRAHV